MRFAYATAKGGSLCEQRLGCWPLCESRLGGRCLPVDRCGWQASAPGLGGRTCGMSTLAKSPQRSLAWALSKASQKLLLTLRASNIMPAELAGKVTEP